MSAPRVSPPRVSPEAERSPRPPAGSAGSADAYRQTSFLLGESVELILEGLRLESAVAKEAAGSRYRNVTAAALLATGSRAWLARLQALHAIEGGAYAAAVALIASAAEHEAAGAALLADDGGAWREWLDGGGLGDLHEAHATELALGAAPEAVGIPPLLAETRDAAAALAAPSPGASLLLAGGESGAARLAVTFGDRDFHMALAELTSGWLLALGVARIGLLLEADGALPVSDADALRRWTRAARGALEGARHCRIERREIGGAMRYVVENWRRAPAGAGRRLVL